MLHLFEILCVRECVGGCVGECVEECVRGSVRGSVRECKRVCKRVDRWHLYNILHYLLFPYIVIQNKQHRRSSAMMRNITKKL